MSSRVKKLTPQREHFARLIVRGYSGAEAYRRSYTLKPTIKPNTIWQEASRLVNNPLVAARISELTTEAATRAAVTRESMLTEMQVNRDLALDAGELSVAQSASRDRARVGGLMKDADDAGSKGLNVTIILNTADAGLA